mgnify:CR=1 FL=1
MVSAPATDGIHDNANRVQYAVIVCFFFILCYMLHVTHSTFAGVKELMKEG